VPTAEVQGGDADPRLGATRGAAEVVSLARQRRPRPEDRRRHHHRPGDAQPQEVPVVSSAKQRIPGHSLEGLLLARRLTWPLTCISVVFVLETTGRPRLAYALYSCALIAVGEARENAGQAERKEIMEVLTTFKGAELLTARGHGLLTWALEEDSDQPVSRD
jgi:hypothetical protein